jgi:poly(3-hydroxyalkanoate) synthetase
MAPLHPWFGFVAASIAAGRGAFDALSGLIEPQLLSDALSGDKPREWATPHGPIRELATMRVLDFSNGLPGSSAIIVAPFALHSATTADFAAAHSVVEALLDAGVTRIVLTDWRSAGESERYLSIDSCLADLNVVVDDFGAPAALVGLCQGGWLAAAYAARFPGKVSRMALAGAPIDIAAGRSSIAGLAGVTSPETIAELIALGNGVLLGKLMMAMWPTTPPTPADILTTLQRDPKKKIRENARLQARFLRWHADIVDLPGAFYQQTAEWIFRENRLALGTFVALGERISLSAIVCPLYLLAAEGDEITDPAQMLALSGLAGTPPEEITSRLVPGRHLSLFMGQKIIRRTWPEVARFLGAGAP